MANANANDEVQKHVATITLSKLVPSEYRMWVVQAEATLGVYDCLEIVLGNEQNPTPPINANGNLPAINAALRIRINDWNRRHARAREALLKCLNSADLMKVYSVRESAAGIWTRLHEEYGQILDLEYIRANNEYHILRKAPETSMDDHINQFTRLRQEVDYHKPPNARSEIDGMANLTLLKSLGDGWRIFQLAKGSQIATMSTSMLYAEIRAYDATLKPSKTSTETITPSDQARALYSNMHGQRSGSNRGNYHGAGGKKRGDGKKIRKRDDFDPNKFCTVHGRQGHDAEHYCKAASEREFEEWQS